MPRNQVCELGIHLEGGGGGGTYPRNLINGIGEPLYLGFPTSVHTPNGVCQWFATGVHFGSKRPFTQVHNRSANDQIGVEFVFQVRAEQAFALHGEGGLVLQFHIHIGTRFENGLVENGNRSHCIVHRIVHVLYQCRTAGSNSNTPTWHIHCIQSYLAAACAFVFTCQMELVFL